MTVFTNQQEYCRKENLELTCAALKDKWDMNLSVNKKHDILLNNTWKVYIHTYICSYVFYPIIQMYQLRILLFFCNADHLVMEVHNCA